ncbi:hypothetical protein OJAV_G00215080 [Oryzias javanicus]|uniref:Uncharacterized protein n=1 Tax=Oryzias javanicus TaxID=123683 RepID=A0A3S2TWW6_ORYJA|nr:hypothetical protein OJAV_G00215080 [Oryzias javanicus]
MQGQLWERSLQSDALVWSSQIANNYLPPQARLKALTIGLRLEFMHGISIQSTSNSSRGRGSVNTHMRGKAQRKI